MSSKAYQKKYFESYIYPRRRKRYYLKRGFSFRPSGLEIADKIKEVYRNRQKGIIITK